MTKPILLCIAAGLIAGCGLLDARRQADVVVPDSLVRPGLLLENRGDTSFRLEPRWRLVHEDAIAVDEERRYVVSERMLSSRPRFSGVDTRVVRLDSNRVIAVAPGVTPLVVRHRDRVDTVRLVVAVSRGRLVVGMDSTSVPHRPAYHDPAWDTVGGAARRTLVPRVRRGMHRDSLAALLGEPHVTCISGEAFTPRATYTCQWLLDSGDRLVVLREGRHVERWWFEDRTTLDGRPRDLAPDGVPDRSPASP